MANLPYLPDFRHLTLPRGLEDAPVVHQLDPGDLGRSGHFIIGFLMANVPYLPDFRPLTLLHGLEDAPVVHQLDHDHLGEVGRPHRWLYHGKFALPT